MLCNEGKKVLVKRKNYFAEVKKTIVKPIKIIDSFFVYDTGKGRGNALSGADAVFRLFIVWPLSVLLEMPLTC